MIRDMLIIIVAGVLLVASLGGLTMTGKGILSNDECTPPTSSPVSIKNTDWSKDWQAGDVKECINPATSRTAVLVGGKLESGVLKFNEVLGTGQFVDITSLLKDSVQGVYDEVACGREYDEGGCNIDNKIQGIKLNKNTVFSVGSDNSFYYHIKNGPKASPGKGKVKIIIDNKERELDLGGAEDYDGFYLSINGYFVPDQAPGGAHGFDIGTNYQEVGDLIYNNPHNTLEARNLDFSVYKGTSSYYKMFAKESQGRFRVGLNEFMIEQGNFVEVNKNSGTFKPGSKFVIGDTRACIDRFFMNTGSTLSSQSICYSNVKVEVLLDGSYNIEPRGDSFTTTYLGNNIDISGQNQFLKFDENGQIIEGRFRNVNPRASYSNFGGSGVDVELPQGVVSIDKDTRTINLPTGSSLEDVNISSFPVGLGRYTFQGNGINLDNSFLQNVPGGGALTRSGNYNTYTGSIQVGLAGNRLDNNGNIIADSVVLSVPEKESVTFNNEDLSISSGSGETELCFSDGRDSRRTGLNSIAHPGGYQSSLTTGRTISDLEGYSRVLLSPDGSQVSASGSDTSVSFLSGSSTAGYNMNSPGPQGQGGQKITYSLEDANLDFANGGVTTYGDFHNQGFTVYNGNTPALIKERGGKSPSGEKYSNIYFAENKKEELSGTNPISYDIRNPGGNPLLSTGINRQGELVTSYDKSLNIGDTSDFYLGSIEAADYSELNIYQE